MYLSLSKKPLMMLTNLLKREIGLTSNSQHIATISDITKTQVTSDSVAKLANELIRPILPNNMTVCTALPYN